MVVNKLVHLHVEVLVLVDVVDVLVVANLDVEMVVVMDVLVVLVIAMQVVKDVLDNVLLDVHQLVN